MSSSLLQFVNRKFIPEATYNPSTEKEQGGDWAVSSEVRRCPALGVCLACLVCVTGLFSNPYVFSQNQFETCVSFWSVNELALDI